MERVPHQERDAASTLADLVDARAEEITARWSERSIEGLGERLRGAALVDHLPQLLGEIVVSLRAGRSLPGAGEDAPGRQHGRQRHRVGANLDQVVREYGLLRDVILAVAEERGLPIPVRDFRVLTDVLGKAIAESVTEFVSAREAALRDSELRLRQLAEAMPQMVWTTDGAGKLDFLNGRWLAYTGAAPEEALEHAWSAVHPDDAGRTRERWEASTHDGEPFEVEYRLRRFDGVYRWHLARGVPVRGSRGRIERWFGTTTDVDDLKQLEAALRDSDRRKSEFLRVLSHELRNPLAPIRSSIFVLERAPSESDRAVHAKDVLRRQTEHLTRLIDDLLDLTRIASGKVVLRRERVDLDGVIRRAGEDHRSLFEQRGIVFSVEGADRPAWVDGDPTRLTQIVGNLLQNAAKFTPAGGHVSLSLAAGEGAAEIRVRDDGAGIDPALRDRLFQPLAQGERTLARSRGGLGLGLALVKGLAELHGGTARAASEGPGRGAELVVHLPLASAGARRAGAPRRAARAAARRVLVVDDNRDAADSLAELISLLGHEVDVAYDGATAIEKIRERPPEVVLCDIGLPGMSGYEVARAVRELGDGSVRLVAVSGYAQPDDLREAEEAGFERHLAKPASAEDIARLLQ